MKIYFKDEFGDSKLHQVSYLSFVKCVIYAQLGIGLVVYGTIFAVGFLLGITGLL